MSFLHSLPFDALPSSHVISCRPMLFTVAFESSPVSESPGTLVEHVGSFALHRATKVHSLKEMHSLMETVDVQLKEICFNEYAGNSLF